MGLASCLEDEGIVITPTLLYSQGVLNKTFMHDFLHNVRSPEERLGDLRAQTASLSRGKIRIHDILKKYTVEHVFYTLDQLKEYAERLMQNVIEHLPMPRR